MKKRMQRSGCLNMTITAPDQHSLRRGDVPRFYTWFQTVSRSISASLKSLMSPSTDNLRLPQHRSSTTMSASSTTKPVEPVSERAKYLMTCIHRTQHHVILTQNSLQDVATDRQLFWFLQAQIRLYRGNVRNLLSMKRVQKIFFVKGSCPAVSSQKSFP